MDYLLPFDIPLLPDFADYILFDGFLHHEADRVRELWVDERSIEATLSGDEAYNENLRSSSVIFLEPSDETQWIYERITSLATLCNAERYRFELSGYVQALQLTQYEKGQFFNWHMDFHAGEISHRKLSVTVQLSDEDSYEGGDLEFMINDRVQSAPRSKGTVIVFPSFIMHRVTPVTAGKRHSIVGWLSGPPFR